MTAVAWDDATESFRADRGLGTWRRVCDTVHVRRLRPWLGRGRRALKTDLFDESAGDGLTALLDRTGAEVHGIDVGLEIVRGAVDRHRELRGTVGDVRDLPFAAGSFDLVLSNSTLDHFESTDDIVRSLAEIRRVTAPGGRLIVSLDNPTNPVIRLRAAIGYARLHRIGVLPYFVGATLDRRALVRAVRDAGFVVDGAAGLLHVPRFPAVLTARLADRTRSDRVARLVIGACTAFEVLERLPTRWWTANFVVVRAHVAEDA